MTRAERFLGGIVGTVLLGFIGFAALFLVPWIGIVLLLMAIASAVYSVLSPLIYPHDDVNIRDERQVREWMRIQNPGPPTEFKMRAPRKPS
jgi:hypothetical protein